MWNNNGDRYSDFGHFYKEKVFENVETSLYSLEASATSDHGVAGSKPAGGEILPEPKRRFIAQSLSCSPFHRLEMTEILLKGRKTLTHPSIYISRALSVGQYGILTMRDTPILAIFYENKFFENVETSLYSPGFVSSSVWNTNSDRYSSFGHFYEKNLPILAIFLKMWKLLAVKRSFHIS